jgi:hypothetical protein
MPDDANMTHDPDAIVQCVLGPYLDAQEAERRRVGSTRGVVVVDATTDGLASALVDANFQVVRAARKLAGPDDRRALLSHRILVTRSTADYLTDAPVLDYGIIGLDALPVVEEGEAYAQNATAQRISHAVSKRGLVSMRGAWVLMLVPDGEHALVRLE